jgi:hypothetical protein
MSLALLPRERIDDEPLTMATQRKDIRTDAETAFTVLKIRRLYDG